MNIQWYPGHMTKTRRQIEADLKHVDIVVEIIDARIPVSSRNPDIDAITAGKPRLVVLNRADQADPAGNRAWGAWFRKKGWSVLETDAKTGAGVSQFSRVVQEVLKDQIARWQEKGLVGRPVRAMVVGVPNVGKSTLTNALGGEKVAIGTNKPQTTRSRSCASLNRGESQFVFVDTPGLHRARTRLGDYMVNVVKESVADVDGVLLLVEPIPNIGDPERELIARIKSLGCPSVLVINKVDTLEHKEKLLEVIQVYGQAHDFTAVVPISAKSGEGVEELLGVLEGFLPEGPQLFPEDMVTDQPERQIMAEILREKLLLCPDKEIPHGTAVEITKFSERDDEVIEIDATIYCEKNSHKGIIIGKGGAMLKKVSTLARQDMERFMGTKVYLQTWVKVKENWRDNPSAIQNFGYRKE